jgi:TatD DNase family protein
MQLVDTHCHIQTIAQLSGEEHTRELWNKLKNSSLDNVIEVSKQAGVDRLIVVGCTSEDSRMAQELAQKHSKGGLWASIGIHPHEASNQLVVDSSLKLLNDLVIKPKVVAVGECGLDYYYQYSPKKEQIKILEKQIELALTNDLPLIFHVRQAFNDFWPIVDSLNSARQPIKGVVHSFTDNLTNMNKVLERNLFIGVNGIATFAKNPVQIEVFRMIPLSNLVLETDSPYLTPSPIRGTINIPKNVGLIAAYLAEIKGIKVDTLAKVTTDNAVKLFNLN